MPDEQNTPLVVTQLHIELPLPPKELHPNARPNRWVKAAKTRYYRGVARLLAIECGAATTGWASAEVQLTYFFTTKRNRDRDNLTAWFKAGFDGIADAGVIDDDSGFTHRPVLCEICEDRPRVEVRVWEVR